MITKNQKIGIVLSTIILIPVGFFILAYTGTLGIKRELSAKLLFSAVTGKLK